MAEANAASMTSIKIPGALVFVLLISVAGTAQQRPDFSGQWILASPSTSNAATEMTVEFWVSDSSSPREYVGVDRWFATERFETFDTILDSPLVRVPGGRDQNGQFAAFEGQTLVIQRFNLSNRASLLKEVWSLTPDGNLRIITTERPASGDPVTTEAMYRRTEGQ